MNKLTDAQLYDAVNHFYDGMVGSTGVYADAKRIKELNEEKQGVRDRKAALKKLSKRERKLLDL